MQISSALRSGSFQSRRPTDFRKGFTLVELLVSIAIIAIITAVVLLSFGQFDSSTLLRSLAYEVATSLREAQVYSLSAMGNSLGTDFDVPYGVTFTPNSNQYTFFYSTVNPVPPDPPAYDVDAVPINTVTIGRTMQVYDLCIVDGVNQYCNSTSPGTITRLDISFVRPDFESMFNVVDLPVGVNNADVDVARIKVRSTGGGNIWYVEVGRLGSISVVKQ